MYVTLTSCRWKAGYRVTGGADNSCQPSVLAGAPKHPRPLCRRVAPLGWGRRGLWWWRRWPNTETQPWAPGSVGRGRGWSHGAVCRSSTRGGNWGRGTRLRWWRDRDGEHELSAHHSSFNQGVWWRFRWFFWQMFGWSQLITYVHCSTQFLAWVAVVCRVLLVQITIVLWRPVWRAFQRLLSLRWLTVARVARANIDVNHSTMATWRVTCTKFQAGAASVSGGSVQSAIRRGVRTLHLQGAQVLRGAGLIWICHLWHH